LTRAGHDRRREQLAGVAKKSVVAVDTVRRFVNVQYRWTEADLAVSERWIF